MATNNNAYYDAYKKSVQQIKDNYNAQEKAATQRKDAYMKTLEANDAVDLRKQRIVLADADVGAGMEMRAALTDKNVAREHELTIRALHAEALRMAVAAVAGGAHSLLVSEELKIHHEHVLYLRSSKNMRTFRG